MLPADLMRFHRTFPVAGTQRAVMPIGKLWMVGSVLHVRFMGGTQAQRKKVQKEALWWTECANLEFVFDDAPDAEIRVSFEPSGGAWSYVGTDCRAIPLDQPTMNLGFLDDGTAAHEFGHTIGLAHEHQNPRSGIEWNTAQVMKDLSGPPNHWTPEQIRHNVLNKYTAAHIKGTDFDPHSIMLYFFPGSWVVGGVGTRANRTLSPLDRSYVGGPEAYPRTEPRRPTAKELVVDATRRTRAGIGNPGEEDLYTFTVETGGTFVADTRGPTDLVMKLYGPDRETALIAEDDNSGVGLNPSITAALVPGVYFLQIRHYRRDDSGVGEYRLKVRSHRP
ncbi:hypothetical protein GCM10017673_18230 [Streptosporangium violaceochromogenes]|nr:hypothetical protein GCM10017673_18230 [Streptosporangium violaceochromogenes]